MLHSWGMNMMHVHDVVKEGYTIKVFLSRCNCKCFTCPYKFVLDRSSIPKYSNIKQIAKKIQTLMSGSKSYYLEFTGGEPMMVWEDIIKMLTELKNLFITVLLKNNFKKMRYFFVLNTFLLCEKGRRGVIPFLYYI